MDEQRIMHIVNCAIETSPAKERALMEALLNEFRESVTHRSSGADATQRRFNELAIAFLREWREWRVTSELRPSIDLMNAIHIFEEFAVTANFIEDSPFEGGHDDR